MGFGTDHGRAVPYIWHKKSIDLPLDASRGGAYFGALSGTQNDGSVYGLVFYPDPTKNKTTWSAWMPGDWDGTSAWVFRLSWAQHTAGDQKDAVCLWNFNYWVCQDWDNPVGSKSVAQTATYTYGDEGTTNHCMHCGTFEMDFTSGTYGTVAAGNTLFMQLWMPPGAAGYATAIVLNAAVEYMAGVTGPSGVALTTQDKRGS